MKNKIEKLTDSDLQKILEIFGVRNYEAVTLKDTSKDTQDIRLNYVIDKKYVLRLNTACVMSEGRIAELNRLIGRYNSFGIVAPYFIKSVSGTYTVNYKEYHCYFSEYADFATADNADIDETALNEEILASIARFAEKYRNTDLTETMSMYSLFRLSPYDIEYGIDEKQQNFDVLIENLKSVGNGRAADLLIRFNGETRNKLKSIYAELPKCVFQGDENFSNVLVDESGRFKGLIDFNMAGCDAVVNYFANIAVEVFAEADFKRLTAQQMLDKAVESYKKRVGILAQNYKFSPIEKKAINLYAKIVFISGYPNERFFSYFLGSPEYRSKVLKLLMLIPDIELSDDF